MQPQVVIHLKDCAFPLLTDVVATGDINEGFRDTDWCLLIGAVPRKEGMERKDLLGKMNIQVNHIIIISSKRILDHFQC